MAKILKLTKNNLEICKRALKKSDIIAVPTETVYGLAGNALDEIAVNKIFKTKKRPASNPLIIHTDCLNNAKKYGVFNPLAIKIAKNYWPGPLTLVVPKTRIVPDIVTANQDSVAIRCPQNQTFLSLLKELPFPLAAPSANPFGYISPTSAKHVNDSLGDKIDLILDGNVSEIGIESTIIDLRDPDTIKILRPGPISENELSLFSEREFTNIGHAEKKEIRAPGMLKSHYSPNTQLEKVNLHHLVKMINEDNNHNCGFIFHKKPKEKKYSQMHNIFWLSKKGLEQEISHNFYKTLRNADLSNFKIIYIQEFTETEGLKGALNDRLTRAIFK